MTISDGKKIFVTKNLVLDAYMKNGVLNIKIPKSNIKAYPIARSKKDCKYLIDIYSVEWIKLERDDVEELWYISLCDDTERVISKNAIYNSSIYFTKEAEDEPVYIDKAPTSDEYDPLSLFRIEE